MDTIIALSSLFLSVFSLMVYLKSPGQPTIRAVKGIVAFFAPFIAISFYINGEYTVAFIIAVAICYLSFRRVQLTKLHVTPVSFPAPILGNGEYTSTAKAKRTPSKTSLSKQNPAIENIAFGYTDSNGGLTYREVNVKKVDEDYIIGYCLKRRQLRTFRIDRVEDSEIVIRDSGEVLNIYDWIIQLYPISD